MLIYMSRNLDSQKSGFLINLFFGHPVFVYSLYLPFGEDTLPGGINLDIIQGVIASYPSVLASLATGSTA